MRLLLLTESLPYPVTSGTRLRAYYMLRSLSQSHAVTLVSFAGPNPDPEHLRHLESLCEQLQLVEQPAETRRRAGWRSLFAAHPSGADHPARAQMETLVRALLTEHVFDALQAQQTAMASYALLVDEVQRPRPRLLLDAFPVANRQLALQHRLSGGVTRWRLQWPLERVRAYEALLCRRFDALLTASAEEKGALLHLLSPEEAEKAAGKVTVLPLGVDAEETELVVPSSGERDPQILFLADFSRPENCVAAAWFIGRVLPLVTAQDPRACLILAGPHPPEEMRLLVKAVGAVPEQVTVAGFVADPLPLWQQCRVSVAPHVEPSGPVPSVLEAWLRGVPVVATRSALEGLTARPGQTNLLADDPRTFAQAVLSLLADDAMADGISRNARHWVRRHYDWRQVYGELDVIYFAPDSL